MKIKFPSTCFHKACPNHDESESGCRIHSAWTTDLCKDYQSSGTREFLEQVAAGEFITENIHETIDLLITKAQELL